MARELAHQTDIRKSVIKDGGYGFKLSNRFTLGIPDLLICLPPFAPCIIEVKDLGEVVDKFNRQIGVTPLQNETMRRISQPYEDYQHPYTPHRCASAILVHVIHQREHRLVGLPRRTEHLSASYLDEPTCWQKRDKGGYYDLAPILEHLGMLKINNM